MKGLHPQTPDSRVFEYLKCIGKVERSKVVLDTFKDGPLKGLQNGDRRYAIEFNPNIAIGTLHIIDGQKVTFSFPGQRRSCFRCLNVSSECPGFGIARDCEAAGGSKKLLALHMQEFWKKINYSPVILPAVDDISVDPEIIEQQIGGTFTPKIKQNACESHSVKKCRAVSIKWFPKKADHGDILKFLVGHGLPSGHESVNVKDNGQVIVSDLDPKISEKLCESLSGSKFNNKKTIYCQGIVLATPSKCSSAQQVLDKPQPMESGNKSQSENSSVDDDNDDFVYETFPNSKFFTKPNDSDIDDIGDDEWLLSKNSRKRKQQLSGSVSIKRTDKKPTPKSKK